MYSANEMLREVENETEVGLDHIGMMLGEFEDSLEADDGTQQYDDDEL